MRIRKLDDFHLHARQGDLLKAVLPHSIQQCARALLMPNVTPPITSPARLDEYVDEAFHETVPLNSKFLPYFTFKITDSLDWYKVLLMLRNNRLLIAGKAYPVGVTTNSEDGVGDWNKVYPILEIMQERGIVLCIHGEEPGVPVLEREEVFIEKHLQTLVTRFPKLKIVIEHVSNASTLMAIESAPDTVAGTITLHHLIVTLDELLGNTLNPSLFCKPIVKREQDRSELRWAAIRKTKCFFGSDSAPHLINKKYCECGAAGVYSAPVLIPALYELLEEMSPTTAMEMYEEFATRRGARFYGLEEHNQTVELIEEPWTVPDSIDGVVPFLAGKRLKYKVVPNQEDVNATMDSAKLIAN